MRFSRWLVGWLAPALVACAGERGTIEDGDGGLGTSAQALEAPAGDEVYLIGVESLEPHRTTDEPVTRYFISMIATSADLRGGSPVPMWPPVRHHALFHGDVRATNPRTVYRNDVNGQPASVLPFVTMTPTSDKRLRLVVLGDADSDEEGIPDDAFCSDGTPGACPYASLHDFMQQIGEGVAAGIGRTSLDFVDPRPESLFIPVGFDAGTQQPIVSEAHPGCVGPFMSLALEFTGRELHDMTENPGRVAFVSDWHTKNGPWWGDWCGDRPQTRYVISIRRVQDVGFGSSPVQPTACTIRPVAGAPASAWHFNWGDVGRHEEDSIRASIRSNDAPGTSFSISSWQRTDYRWAGEISSTNEYATESTSWQMEPFRYNRFPAPTFFLGPNGTSSVGDVGNVQPLTPRCAYYSNLEPYWQATDDGNRVRDPGFERQGARALNPPWTSEINGGVTGVDTSLGFSRTGANNGFIWTDRPGWNALVQDVFVEPNHTYRASLWVRAPSNVQWGYFGVRDANNTIIRETTWSGSGNYRQLNVDFQSGPRSKVRLNIGYWAPSGTATWAQIDDARIAPPPSSGGGGGGPTRFVSFPNVDRISLSEQSEVQLWGEYDELGNLLAYRPRYLRWNSEDGRILADVMLRPTYQLR